MRILILGCRHFVQNIILTLRAFLPVRFDISAAHTTPGQIALALIAANAASVAFMAARNWPVGGFDPWGLTSLLAGSFLSVTALALSALVVLRGRSVGAIIVVGSLASIFSGPLWWVLNAQAEHVRGPVGAWAIWLAWFLPQILIILRGLAGTSRIGWLRGVPAMAAYLGLTVTAGTVVPFTDMFYPAELASAEDEGEAYRPVDVEELYYAQPARMQAAIAGLKPGQAGQREVFALLGAGTSMQGVFLREIAQVADIARTRLDADGRILSLANSGTEPDRYPLLSKHNLREGLREVGARMQKDEDIAFLFLTSHGSPEKFSLGFYEAGLNDLTSGDLSDMLDGSGIRYAVVVISACYSGSFIDDLAAPGRIIITAAAADRTSFGCASENQWTDFGRAYFDEALRETGDFRIAFDREKATVAEREAARGLKPSLPQMSVGAEIAAYLDGTAPGAGEVGN